MPALVHNMFHVDHSQIFARAAPTLLTSIFKWFMVTLGSEWFSAFMAKAKFPLDCSHTCVAENLRKEWQPTVPLIPTFFAACLISLFTCSRFTGAFPDARLQCDVKTYSSFGAAFYDLLFLARLTLKHFLRVSLLELVELQTHRVTDTQT